MHREEKLSFKNVITFNLDEYYPIDNDALQSYNRFMRAICLIILISIQTIFISRMEKYQKKISKNIAGNMKK